MNSILQTERECYETGRTDNLHKHHIYYGRGMRDISEKNRFWVYLTGEYHNQSTVRGVHFDNYLLDHRLKRECQKKFLETHSLKDWYALAKFPMPNYLGVGK